MEAIVAVYGDWGIGAGGTQPVVLKADRQHFWELTEGATVIVGRRTLEDLPGGKPLKGRRSIVITRQEIDIPGAEVAHSTVEALALSAGGGRCLVIGGESVFRQFLPFTELVHVTKIALTPKSDSFFEDLDQSEEWTCQAQGPWQEENGLRFCFCTYRRVS